MGAMKEWGGGEKVLGGCVGGRRRVLGRLCEQGGCLVGFGGLWGDGQLREGCVWGRWWAWGCVERNLGGSCDL